MNTHTDKTQENKGKSIVNTVAQKQNNSESALQLVDDRPEALTQRKLQETANNSPQAKQTAQLQAMADGYSARQEFAIQKKANNTGLPDDLKSGIENLSGYSMDDVKVHYNSDKPGQLQAHAYAQGTDIHVASGQEKHLPHEAWHVVQQKQGRVQPTFQMKGKVNINDDAGLEKEADVMGERATSSTQLKSLTSIYLNQQSSNNSIQRKEVLQRIVVMDDTQIDLGTIVDVYQILTKGIDSRVTMMSILSKTDIEGEQLGLMGHGSKDSFAGKSGDILAEFLSKSGVSNSNLVIDVLACDTGGGDFIDSFVESLTRYGISTTVYANEGSGVTLGNGYTYSVTPGTTAESEEYDKILISFNTEIKTGEQIALVAAGEVKKVVDLVNSNAISSKDAEGRLVRIFLKYGEDILKVTGDLFNRLYEYQSKIISADKSQNKGVVVKNS